MEIAQSLSIESFSYSWLVNLRPSLDSLDTSLGASLDASFTEMDPTMPPSKRFFQDFNKFYFHTSQTPPPTLVHADELFADGYILPFFVNHSSPTLLATSSQREQNPDKESGDSALVVNQRWHTLGITMRGESRLIRKARFMRRFYIANNQSGNEWRMT
ncbi:Detected protein of confused Function [Hibiscus syriacus]|uniref:Detected protein of confused Function n=1 Tax=Hibiscus syriacus TaxID=106335 RepID=A0A6A3CHJ0_HIBSY|nr:Detected protein of confused Function [Hibiscus syriacus]